MGSGLQGGVADSWSAQFVNVQSRVHRNKYNKTHNPNPLLSLSICILSVCNIVNLGFQHILPYAEHQDLPPRSPSLPTALRQGPCPH